MWEVSGNNIAMTVGDYGLSLPVKINGTTLTTGTDTVRLTVKNNHAATEALKQEYSVFDDNTFSIVLTEEESERLKPGEYAYSLDWYRDGVFMCNIVPKAVFRVVRKI